MEGIVGRGEPERELGSLRWTKTVRHPRMRNNNDVAQNQGAPFPRLAHHGQKGWRRRRH